MKDLLRWRRHRPNRSTRQVDPAPSGEIQTIQHSPVVFSSVEGTSPLCVGCHHVTAGVIRASKPFSRYDIFETVITIGSDMLQGRAGCHLCQLVTTSLLTTQGNKTPVSTLTSFATEPKSLPKGKIHYELLSSVLSVDFENGDQRVPIIGLNFAQVLSNGVATGQPFWSSQSRIAPFSEENSSTSSRICTDLVKHWMSICQHHEKCQASNTESDVFAPTRLVEVSNDTPPKVRLRYGVGIAPSEKYLTLSHCWGSQQPLRLLESNLMTMLAEIPLKNLPKTFFDTVHLTQRLKIKYVWIDSLCIIQDVAKDWLLESSRMGQVYSNAYCNISAAAASSSSKGLFVTRDPNQPRALQTRSPNLENLYHFFNVNLWAAEVDHSPINSRAWVLQERHLSKRIVYFGSNQIYWECHQLQACEQYADGILPQMITNPTRQFPDVFSAYNSELHQNPVEFFNFAFELWGSVIEKYTRAKLTFPTDRLIAISGLASRFRDSILSYLRMLFRTFPGLRIPKFSPLREFLGTEFDHSHSSLYADTDARHNHKGGYVAGIWIYEAPSQLLWQTVQAPIEQRDLPFIAPSWSWAALNMEVTGAYKKKLHDSHDLISVLSWSTTSLKVEDPYGSISDGFLVLEGKLVQWGRNSLMRFFDTYPVLYWDMIPVSDPHKEDEFFYLLPIRLRNYEGLKLAVDEIQIHRKSGRDNWSCKEYTDWLSIPPEIPIGGNRYELDGSTMKEAFLYELEGIILKETHLKSEGQDGISMTFKRVGKWGIHTHMKDTFDYGLREIVLGVQYMDSEVSGSEAEDANLGNLLLNIFENRKTHKIKIL